MNYSRRVAIAVCMSVILHAFLLWIGRNAAEAVPRPLHEQAKAPIVFRLNPEPMLEPMPEKKEPVKRLISTPNPTNEEVEDTDLISDSDSKAQDNSDGEGERLAPHTDEAEEFDRVEQSPPAQVPAEPTPQVIEEIVPAPEPVTQIQSNSKAAPTPTPKPEPVMTEEIQAIQDMIDELVAIREFREATEQEESEQQNEDDVENADETGGDLELKRYQLAQALPQELQPPRKKITQDFSGFKAREDGGTLNSGVMNFEAKRHELGAYMLEVRKRVERRWHASLALKYMGVKRANATVECIIRPSGIIESVTIIDSGTSMPFAILCRESILSAGPFPKLGFEVPELYRSQNLEIRWKFSYM